MARSIYMNRILISAVLICFVGILPAVAGNDAGIRLVSAARVQIGKTVRYDPRYQSIQYPNGDLPMDRGVCTDVIVRAFRAGLGGVEFMKLHGEDRSFRISSTRRLASNGLEKKASAPDAVRHASGE